MKYEMMDAKKIIGDVVAEQANKNPLISVVSTDSAPRTGLTEFIKNHPDRYYECGIAEQGAMAVASGLATTGKTAVFCAPAPFATLRPFEMLKIDVGYMRQNVKVIGRNCGFNYADLGPTHFGVEDMGAVRLIPEITILAPADASQLKGALTAAFETEGPVYLRVSTAPIPKIFEEKPFEIGKGIVQREGKDVAIVTTGEITANVLEAVEILIGKGIDPMVVLMPTVSPLDRELLAEVAQKTGRIVTVEEHFVNGGLGSSVCEVIAESNPVPVKRLGVPHEYVFAGQYADLTRFCKLDPTGIAESIESFLK